MRTLVASPFEDDAAEILEWGYGPMAKLTFLTNALERDQRVGQAFMNTLRVFDMESYRRLSGSLADPFFDDQRLGKAIDRLTSK
jgi:hypothetical protein